MPKNKNTVAVITGCHRCHRRCRRRREIKVIAIAIAIAIRLID